MYMKVENIVYIMYIYMLYIHFLYISSKVPYFFFRGKVWPPLTHSFLENFVFFFPDFWKKNRCIFFFPGKVWKPLTRVKDSSPWETGIFTLLRCFFFPTKKCFFFPRKSLRPTHSLDLRGRITSKPETPQGERKSWISHRGISD